MREDRSRAHVLHALTGQMKSRSVSCLLLFFIYEDNHQIEWIFEQKMSEMHREIRVWRVLVRKVITKQPMTMMSLVWGPTFERPKSEHHHDNIHQEYSPGIMDGCVQWILGELQRTKSVNQKYRNEWG